MTLRPRDGWTKRYDETARAAGKESWAAWVLEVEKRKGRTICGRMLGQHSKAPGTPCERNEGAGVVGKPKVGACVAHNGDTAAGAASHMFKHGREARSPSTGGRTLRQKLEEHLDSEPRKMMQLSAAFLMARFDDLVEGSGVDADAMVRAREALAEIKGATSVEAMKGALGRLEEIVKEGAGAAAAMEEFYRLVPLIGQHAERYRKVMETAGEYVERERALALFDRFGRDVVDLVDGLEDLTLEQKRTIRRGLAGIILGYTNRRVLPPSAEEPT